MQLPPHLFRDWRAQPQFGLVNVSVLQLLARRTKSGINTNAWPAGRRESESTVMKSTKGKLVLFVRTLHQGKLIEAAWLPPFSETGIHYN